MWAIFCGSLIGVVIANVYCEIIKDWFLEDPSFKRRIIGAVLMFIPILVLILILWRLLR
jgi:uncharacterized membrane protein